VFLLYGSSKGQALIDRALYFPQEWTQDPLRCLEAGVPESVGFATRGALAQRMLTRAFAAAVKADRVVADTVSGSDEMRDWLESQRQKSVLAVPETHQVWSPGEPQPVGLLWALLPPEAWAPLSAGEGSQGARLSQWAWLQLPYEREQGQGWTPWLLIRRNLSDHSKRAYYRAWGPAQTPLTTLVQVAGSRWTVEEGL
jgi:SRSO17 transposase